MEPFVRLTQDGATLSPELRVLKVRDHLTLEESERVLADARRRAEAILASAEQEFEAQKQQGREEGMLEAKMELAEQMMDTVSRAVDYFSQVEKQVASVVMASVRKILGEFDDEELTMRVVRNALQVVRNQQQVTLRVSPEQEPAVRQRLQEILAGYTGIGFVEVVRDSRLAPGGSVLETEIGVVDAGVEVQLRALENAMRSRIRAQGGR